MRVSSATIAVTSAAMAPRDSMSAMKRRTAPRSGSNALVIGGVSSLGAGIEASDARPAMSIHASSRFSVSSYGFDATKTWRPSLSTR